MKILKKLSAYILAGALAVSGLSVSAGAEEVTQRIEYTGEELVERIENTHREALERAGRSSFYNRCSQLVNYTTVVLGLQTQRYTGNGNQEYNLYEDITRTDCGYDVEKYPAGDYTLEQALNAISEDGTKNVYNIIIGWQSGNSRASRRYGHTCFIHGIVDGEVYFYESYSLSVGGTYYSAGSPIICSISEFADYYDWASFEGAVHLDFPEIPEPKVGDIQVSDESAGGFTLSFSAENVREDGAWVKVWTYGNSNSNGYRLIPAEIMDGVAVAEVKTSDFNGFVGRYYAEGFGAGVDGQTARCEMEAGESADLYTAEAADGLYRVPGEGAVACNAPAWTINGVSTQQYAMEPDTEFSIVGSMVDENGLTWLQLDDGFWVNGECVRRVIRMADLVEYFDNMIRP